MKLVFNNPDTFLKKSYNCLSFYAGAPDTIINNDYTVTSGKENKRSKIQKVVLTAIPLILAVGIIVSAVLVTPYLALTAIPLVLIPLITYVVANRVISKRVKQAQFNLGVTGEGLSPPKIDSASLYVPEEKREPSISSADEDAPIDVPFDVETRVVVWRKPDPKEQIPLNATTSALFDLAVGVTAASIAPYIPEVGTYFIGAAWLAYKVRNYMLQAPCQHPA